MLARPKHAYFRSSVAATQCVPANRPEPSNAGLWTRAGQACITNFAAGTSVVKGDHGQAAPGSQERGLAHSGTGEKCSASDTCVSPADTGRGERKRGSERKWLIFKGEWVGYGSCQQRERAKGRGETQDRSLVPHSERRPRPSPGQRDRSLCLVCIRRWELVL